MNAKPHRQIEDRKRALTKLLRKAALALQLNEYIAEPGDVVFRHACRLPIGSR
jgi:hypothetical protein